jgi:iron(III) transport system substrate-binding protein
VKPALVLVLAAAATVAGCGGGGGSSGPLTIYSGREEELVAPLFEMFTEQTGIEVEVRYGDSAELAATIAEEGENSPADAFFSQDPGSLGAIESQLSELPQEILERVDRRFRDSDGRWVGTSGRARVIVYNTDELIEDQVPDSVFDLTHAHWKASVGIAPTNASFQAFVTGMRLADGDEKTREWLEALKRNEPKFYEKNAAIVEAVAAGEVEVGLVNHYYLYLIKAESPDAPVANHFLARGDPGALVSVAGAGVLESADDTSQAEQFIEYLLSQEGQRFYVDAAEEAEYPLIEGIEPKEGLPSLTELEGPDVDLTSFGAEHEATIELLRDTGFLT